MVFRRPYAKASARLLVGLFVLLTLGILRFATTAKDSYIHKHDLQYTDTVILGAGVIGLATAYQLALAFRASTENGGKSTGPKIVVIEPASHVAPAASGQATGGLGDFGLQKHRAELRILSYDLLEKLAFPHGAKQFRYSDSHVYRVTPENFTGVPKPPDNWGPSAPVGQPLSALPKWIRSKDSWRVQLMAGPPHAAHLYVFSN